MALGGKKCGTGMGAKKDEAEGVAARTALYALLPDLVKTKIKLESGTDVAADDIVAVRHRRRRFSVV